MGSGGGSQSQTQTTQLPGWAQPFAQAIFGQAMPTYFPGNQIAPAASTVAGFSPDQLAAMQMTEALSGVAPNAGRDYVNFNAGAKSNFVGPQFGATGQPAQQAPPQSPTFDPSKINLSGIGNLGSMK